VLLDRQSMIVAYDPTRGEPRMTGKVRPAGAGDCIDCGACVATCPTGIDIREGLQMECVHCTQCADACDAIMTSIDRPQGLIRYTSHEVLAGGTPHVLRPRTVIYPIALAVVFAALVWQLETKAGADVTLLRSLETPFTENADGTVLNQVRLRIANRTGGDRAYRIDVAGADGGRVVVPVNPFPVASGRTETLSLFVILPRDAFHDGDHAITVRVSDGDDFSEDFPYRLLGPEGETRKSRERDDTNDGAVRRDGRGGREGRGGPADAGADKRDGAVGTRRQETPR
jgi:cytochrome c oxidase accessory protein FixG